MRSKLSEGLVITSNELPSGEWLIYEAWEEEPKITSGNRMSSYENRFKLIKLNADGSYDEDGYRFNISTCYVYSNTIDEDEIEVVRMMTKTYI